MIAKALRGSREELTNAIVLLLGDLVPYVGIAPTSEANSDGYRLSSIVIVETLLKYHLVEVLPDGRLRIHQDLPGCQLLIDDLIEFHKKLVAGDEKTISALFSIYPSETVLQIAQGI